MFSGVVDCGGASYAFSCHDGFVHCVGKEGDGGARRRWRARHGSKITATPQLVKIREKGDHPEDARSDHVGCMVEIATGGFHY